MRHHLIVASAVLLVVTSTQAFAEDYMSKSVTMTVEELTVVIRASAAQANVNAAQAGARAAEAEAMLLTGRADLILKRVRGEVGIPEAPVAPEPPAKDAAPKPTEGEAK